MRNIKVRRHTRVTKNKVSVVRKHSRKLNSNGIVKKFKKTFGINSDIVVKDGDYADAQGTSVAMTESVVDKNSRVPKRHTVTFKMDKVAENGENIKTLLHHELSHILVREKNLKSLPEFKDLINLVKSTDTYKKLAKQDDSYGKDNEEIFARLYSQLNTGDTETNEYLFTPKELRKLLPSVKKLTSKVTGKKQSIKR